MKPKYNPFLTRLTLAASTVFCLGQVAQAAPINWGAGTTIAADSDVLNSGAGSYAYALSGTTRTVNGVAFTGSNSTTALGSNVTLAGWSANTNGAYNSTTNPFNALSADYKAILVGGTYTSGATAATVTLNNLTSGRVYATQIWVGDPRSGSTVTRTETVTSTGGNTVTLDYNTTDAGGGLGQYSIGRFMADASTQLLTMTGNASTQLNAIQVREVTNIGNWVGTAGATWDASMTSNFASNLFSAALNTTTFDVAKAPLNSVTFADTYWNSGSTTAVTQTSVTVAAGGVSTGRVFFDNSAINYTIASADTTGITGTTALVKNGSGTVTFTGANTFTGATTISGGVLRLGDGGTTGNLSGTSSITNNANLTVNRSNAFTQATDLSGKAITGTGSFTQAGGGTTTLSLTNSYSGGTSINNGALAITTGSALGSGLLTLNGGTLVGGAFTVANDIAVNNVANNRIYTNGANLTLSGTWSGNGNLALSGATTPSSIIISGDTTGYSGTINFDGQSSTNNVFVSGVGANLQNAAWNFTNAAVGNNYGFGWNGVGSGTVKLGALSGSFGNIYNNVGSTTMTLEVGNLNTNTIFGGVISNTNGTTALTKVGSGTLILTGANTYSSTTTISGGTLQIGNGGTSGSIGNVAIVNNAALVYSYDTNNAGTGTASLTSGGITGTGSVTATAKNILLNGSVTSGGNQSYTATATSGTYQGISVNAAIVNLTATGGASISLSGELGKQNSSGNTLNIDTSSGNGTVNLDISVGRSGIYYNLTALNVNAGTGTINWSGTRAAAGNQSTPISLTGAINFTSNFACQTAQTLTLNTTGTSLVSGNLTGALSLVKDGGSTLTLTGSDSTYSGSTTIKAGTLVAGTVNGVRGISNNSAVLLGDTTGSANATLQLGTANSTNFSNNVRVQSGNSGLVALNGSGNINLSGTVTLGTDNSSGKSVTIANVGSDPLWIYNLQGAIQNPTGMTAGTAGTVTVGSTGTGTVRFSGANTYTGDTRLAANFFQIYNANALQNSTLDLATGETGTVSAINQNSTLGGIKGTRNLNMQTRTLSIGNNNQDTTYSGALSNGALTKIGSGALTLSNTHTYTGETNVTAGKLVVNGNISTSTLTTVSGTGTLGGSGTVGNLSVTSGGTFAPGNSIDSIDVSGDLTLGVGSFSVFEIDTFGDLSDLANVSGSLVFGGTLNVNNVGGSLVYGDVFNLLDWGGSAFGTFGAVNLPALDLGLSWDQTNLYTSGTLSVVPEPSAALLGGLGILLLLRRKR